MEDRMLKGRYRMYDREFKLRAVEMVEKGEGSMTAVAKGLGVSLNTLSNWCKSYRKNAESASRERKKELTPEQKRIRELEQELKHIKTGFEIFIKRWPSVRKQSNEVRLHG